MGIVLDSAAGRWVFSATSRFSCPCIPELLHSHLISPPKARRKGLERNTGCSSHQEGGMIVTSHYFRETSSGPGERQGSPACPGVGVVFTDCFVAGQPTPSPPPPPVIRRTLRRGSCCRTEAPRFAASYRRLGLSAKRFVEIASLAPTLLPPRRNRRPLRSPLFLERCARGCLSPFWESPARLAGVTDLLSPARVSDELGKILDGGLRHYIYSRNPAAAWPSVRERTKCGRRLEIAGRRRVFPAERWCRVLEDKLHHAVGALCLPCRHQPLHSRPPKGHRKGATVAERLDCSPPTKANRVQSLIGSIPDFRKHKGDITFNWRALVVISAPELLGLVYCAQSTLQTDGALYGAGFDVTDLYFSVVIQAINCLVCDPKISQYHHGSPLVDDRPIMNAVNYRVVSGVVWTNRTMASSNTDTNRTCVLAVVAIGESRLSSDHASFDTAPGNSAPINEHFAIVCPNHVQLSQKGSDLTSGQQQIKERRRLQNIEAVKESTTACGNEPSQHSPDVVSGYDVRTESGWPHRVSKPRPARGLPLRYLSRRFCVAYPRPLPVLTNCLQDCIQIELIQFLRRFRTVETADYFTNSSYTRQQNGDTSPGTCRKDVLQSAPGNLLASRRPDQLGKISQHVVANKRKGSTTSKQLSLHRVSA
ncbi:hypothetical protein PR048_029273 [Dryococelus australis]|uniref:Uncharacterized protein n=1 Tax=Dryococelus australis TaxID=614101 RepID=A0ABQ9GFL3_9NEOP|nr:hypothetical protein PR048_029273 [Dryococelus australis]